MPLYVHHGTNATGAEAMLFQTLDLENYPILEYEGWARIAFLAFLVFILISDICAKGVIFKFLASMKMSDRPINIVFLADQVREFKILSIMGMKHLELGNLLEQILGKLASV